MLTEIAHNTVPGRDDDALPPRLVLLGCENMRQRDIADVDPSASGFDEGVDEMAAGYDGVDGERFGEGGGRGEGVGVRGVVDD